MEGGEHPGRDGERADQRGGTERNAQRKIDKKRGAEIGRKKKGQREGTDLPR